MPTYLCHGFRWKRRSVRVFVVIQNLDDAAPEWVIKRGSPRILIEAFYKLFHFLPDCAFPATHSSSTAPWSHSASHFLDHDHASTPDGGIRDDDDTTSHHTTRSSRSETRNPNRNTTALHQQPSQPFDEHERDQATPTGFRSHSSNSSRKRSKTDTSRGNSSNPLPQTQNSYPPVAYQNHNQGPQPPPSPPLSSQPRGPSTSQASDSSGGGADPVLSQHWSPVKLLEEYDPSNLDEVSPPWAYVADYVTRIDASCSIVEEIQRYESRVRRSPSPAVTGPSSDEMLCRRRDTARLGKGAGWFEQLRDQLQQGEDIRWYVVVNGDEERAWPAEGSVALSGPRTSAVHHTQDMHQQLVLEEQHSDLETRREQLRRELGYEQGGVDRLLDRKLERRPKPPEKDLPALNLKLSRDQLASMPSKTPKTPGKLGFKRLFSRSKMGEETPF